MKKLFIFEKAVAVAADGDNRLGLSLVATLGECYYMKRCS
jgi:hypothetical protein